MLKRNIIANFFGKIWPSLLGFVLVPVYLKYLGVESYGLVGFFVSLQSLISFLDLGLSTTTNREIASGFKSLEQQEATRDFVRTLEFIYGGIALLIALSFALSADWVAHEWVNVEDLSVETVSLAALIFGVTLALRWPVALYSGILQGAEKQVLYNTLYIIINTLRNGGAAIVVAFVSPTVFAYLVWQMFCAVFELGIMSIFGWQALRVNGKHRPHINMALLRPVWKFSFSVGANSLLAALIKQMDRIVISNLLLLAQVGYYSTANVVYSVASIVTSPISSAAFPRFASLLADGNEPALSDAYHKLSQVTSFLAVPVSAVMLYYSYEILSFWTRSADVAIHASSTLSFLGLAALFNSMMNIPFMMQLAAGITWIAVWNNAVSLVVFAPLMYLLISRYGISGAGVSWAIFNILYYSIVPNIMHRYILRKEKLKWYFADTLPFIIIGLFVFGGAHWITRGQGNFFAIVAGMAGGGVVYTIMCLLLLTPFRRLVLSVISNKVF